MERVILCMKWGTAFGPRDVNVLHRACRQNTDGNLTFACITDDATGFDAGITVLPFGEMVTAADREHSGVWPKVGLYQKDLFGLSGRALFLDLDIVVSRPLDPLFDPNLGDYVGMRDERRAQKTGGASSLNTSVVSFNLGEQSHILDAYLSDRAAARESHSNDQNFAEAHANGLSFWPEGWVISFKRHLRRPMGLDLLLAPKAPQNAKVVAFHGDPRPIDLVGKKGLWSDAPHFVRCPVQWLDEYWDRYERNAGTASK